MKNTVTYLSLNNSIRIRKLYSMSMLSITSWNYLEIYKRSIFILVVFQLYLKKVTASPEVVRSKGCEGQQMAEQVQESRTTWALLFWENTIPFSFFPLLLSWLLNNFMLPKDLLSVVKEKSDCRILPNSLTAFLLC